MCFSFAPGELESGLFITREGSIGGSEDVVQPRAAVQGSTVFSLRATMYKVDVDGSSFVWRLMTRRRRVVHLEIRVVRREDGSQKARQCLRRAVVVVTIIGFRGSLHTVFRT